MIGGLPLVHGEVVPGVWEAVDAGRRECARVGGQVRRGEVRRRKQGRLLVDGRRLVELKRGRRDGRSGPEHSGLPDGARGRGGPGRGRPLPAENVVDHEGRGRVLLHGALARCPHVYT